VTGTQAERHLLASLIANPKTYSLTEGLVNRPDFTDDRLGVIFEQIGVMLSRGESVGTVEVIDRFPAWGVRGLTAAEVWSWETPDTYTHGASQYAAAVRGDALRRRAREAGELLISQSQDRGVSPVDVLTQARGLIDASIDGTATGKLAAKPLSEILDGSDSYDWVIDGLLERQDRLILTGGEGAGKTTFARQICVMAAAGLHPLHRRMDARGYKTAQLMNPVKVLVIDAENTEKQWRRATRYTARRAAEEGALDPAQELMVVAGHRIDVTRGVHLGEIHRLVDVHRPDLLYIGPLYKITHGAIQTDDDAAPLLVALDSLRERGVTLLMEAHAAKGDGHGGVRDLRPRGSAALMGWPEFGMGLHPVDDMTVELKRWRGDRDERQWPKFLSRGTEWPWEAA